MKQEKTNRAFLSEFVYLRLILIIALVLYHALCPYTGSWSPFPGIHESSFFYWLGKYSYYFFLPSFVFMSGYLFGFSQKKKKLPMTFKGVVGKKFKRLFIPSIIFSIVYCLMFWDLSVPVYTIGYKILNGAGHMWFLPMLFWCFVAVFLADLLKIKPSIMMGTAIIMALLPIPELPLRLNGLFGYFVFFYIGYAMGRGIYVEKLIYACKECQIWGLMVTYVVSVFLIGALGRDWNEMFTVFLTSSGLPSVLTKAIYATINQILTFLSGLSGMLIVYRVSMNYLVKKYPLRQWMANLSSYCFGVYLFQQFVLQYLYYKTTLASCLPHVITPWAMFFIALATSLLLTFLTLKTRIGRYLIG